MNGEPRDEELRRRRREWIATHHPDRGGDPYEFAAGLARLTAGTPDAAPASVARPTVYRSKNPLRRLRRLVRSVTKPSTRGRRLH